MGEVADLTDLLEHEATRKADGERRSRQPFPTVRKNSNNSDDNNRENRTGDTACHGGPIPSSELRRYGKKLEEAVRSREHAADVVERLALPRRRPPGEPLVRGPAVDESKSRRRKSQGRAAVAHAPEGNARTGSGRGHVLLQSSSPKGLPGAAGSTPLKRRGPEGRRKGSRRRASGGGRGLLAGKLRGAVRVSREEAALGDDERFWS
ncbi:unnamed protein product [Hapterophycus canaliculatus]